MCQALSQVFRIQDHFLQDSQSGTGIGHRNKRLQLPASQTQCLMNKSMSSIKVFHQNNNMYISLDFGHHEGCIYHALHKSRRCHSHRLQCKWCPPELCEGPGGSPEEKQFELNLVS